MSMMENLNRIMLEKQRKGEKDGQLCRDNIQAKRKVEHPSGESEPSGAGYLKRVFPDIYRD